MRLADEIKLKAGGPGSGRHPGNSPTSLYKEIKEGKAKDGYKQIRNVKVGDKIQTHNMPAPKEIKSIEIKNFFPYGGSRAINSLSHHKVTFTDGSFTNYSAGMKVKVH